MSRRRVQITDHALVRYLERVEGFDLAALREQLAERLDEAARLGASAVTIDRHTYRLVDGVCTTVVPRHMRFPVQVRDAREGRE